MAKRLTMFEGAAIAIFSGLCVVALTWWWLYQTIFVGGLLLLSMLVLLGVAFGCVGAYHAFTESWTIGRRLRVALAVPIALLGAFALAPLLRQQGLWLMAKAQLSEHRAQYAGAGRAAFAVVQGIPDGGASIIRTEGESPERWTAGTFQRVAGGWLNGCTALEPRYFLCTFG